jgi:hypothetical protein
MKGEITKAVHGPDIARERIKRDGTDQWLNQRKGGRGFPPKV